MPIDRTKYVKGQYMIGGACPGVFVTPEDRSSVRGSQSKARAQIAQLDRSPPERKAAPTSTEDARVAFLPTTNCFTDRDSAEA